MQMCLCANVGAAGGPGAGAGYPVARPVWEGLRCWGWARGRCRYSGAAIPRMPKSPADPYSSRTDVSSGDWVRSTLRGLGSAPGPRRKRSQRQGRPWGWGRERPARLVAGGRTPRHAGAHQLGRRKHALLWYAANEALPPPCMGGRCRAPLQGERGARTQGRGAGAIVTGGGGVREDVAGPKCPHHAVGRLGVRRAGPLHRRSRRGWGVRPRAPCLGG
jgi:hypothetical protein